MNVLVFKTGGWIGNIVARIARAFEACGHTTTIWDFAPQWSQEKAAPQNAEKIRAAWTKRLFDFAREKKIDLTFCNGANSVLSFVIEESGDGKLKSALADLDVPHACLWTALPVVWNGGVGVETAARGLFDAPNILNFAIGSSTAGEMTEIFGFGNARYLPLGAGPECDVVPPPESQREFDVAFLADAPLYEDVAALAEKGAALDQMEAFWQEKARGETRDFIRGLPPDVRGAVGQTLGAYFTRLARAGGTAFFEHLKSAGEPGRAALEFFRASPGEYRRALVLIQKLRGWERHAIVARLAKRFRVLVCGPERWKDVPGITYGGRAPYEEQPEFYARAKIGFNINQSPVSSSVIFKPLEIVSAGVFCLTQDVSDLKGMFEAGKEVGIFGAVSDVESCVERVLGDEEGCREAARAARDRARREHTWEDRVERLVKAARGA